jgi:hypothetical protein
MSIEAPAPPQATSSTSVQTQKLEVKSAATETDIVTIEGTSAAMDASAGVGGVGDSESELQQKLGKVGVLGQLMKGFTLMNQLVQSNSLVSSYVNDAEFQALVGASSDTPKGEEITIGNETYIETGTHNVKPIKETVVETLGLVRSVVFGLNCELTNQKISFTSFKCGDLAQFVPIVVDNRKIWMAYHYGAPHHYLSEVHAMQYLLTYLLTNFCCLLTSVLLFFSLLFSPNFYFLAYVIVKPSNRNRC